MKYVYPAVFKEEDNQYIVSVPDLKGCHTFGNSLVDAIEMSRDAISMWLCEAEDNKEEIPSPSKVEQIKLNDGFINFIDVDTKEYRKLNDNRSVKKTLSIPNWLNTQAELANAPFSQILQEGLKQYLENYAK